MDLTRDQYRYFLKDLVRLTIDFSETDQSRGVAPPPVQKPSSGEGKRIALAPPQDWQSIDPVDLITAMAERKSVRKYLAAPLSLDELSFLLWATQGVRSLAGPSTVFRTVPSAGCRHSFESYLCVMNVSGLEQGIYRYLPLDNELLLVSAVDHPGPRIARAALGQAFVGTAAVVFIWTCVPYRMEWRYGVAAHKVIAIDAGHVCQNLYLACGAVKAGTCAIAAYDQQALDELLGVDGEDEFAIYLAPVGKAA